MAWDSLGNYSCRRASGAGLAAPNTVNTMPGGTLLAFADHGETAVALSRDGGDAEAVLAKHIKAGIDLTALSSQLQSEGAKGFVKSWNELPGRDRVQEQDSGVNPEVRR